MYIGWASVQQEKECLSDFSPGNHIELNPKKQSVVTRVERMGCLDLWFDLPLNDR